MDALMTVEEVAQLFRLNELTIRRYIKAGKLKAIKVGGRIRVRREDSANGRWIPFAHH